MNIKQENEFLKYLLALIGKFRDRDIEKGLREILPKEACNVLDFDALSQLSNKELNDFIDEKKVILLNKAEFTKKAVDVIIEDSIIMCDSDLEDDCHEEFNKGPNELNENEIEFIMKYLIYTLPKNEVDFDFENIAFGNYQLKQGSAFNITKWVSLDNDNGVFIAAAGGDWEVPVMFIIYWNGKKFLSYVPKAGNHWNQESNRAFNNDEVDGYGLVYDTDLMIKEFKEKFNL